MKRKCIKLDFKVDEFQNNSYKQNFPEMFTCLVDLIDKSAASSISRIVTASKHELKQWIVAATQKLEDGRPMSERLYWILHDLHDFPKCANPKCQNYLSDKHYFKNICVGYQKHCCNHCGQLDPNTTNLKKSTTFMNHGDPNFRNKEKTRQRYVENYGTSHPMKSEKFKSKLVEDHLLKFGKSWYFETTEFKKKSLATLQKNYGQDVVNPFQVESIKREMQRHWLDIYGVDNPTKNPAIVKKVMDSFHSTMLRTYGVYWPMHSHELFVKSKRKLSYAGIQFDSYPEIAYYIWLRDKKVEFEFQPNISFEYEHNGTKHFYYPDFYLLETNEIVELKNSNTFDDNGKMICLYDRSLDALYEAKHQCMLANNVRLILTEEYQTFINYVEQKYGVHFKVEKCIKTR